MRDTSRRDFLTIGTVVLAGLAGCSSYTEGKETSKEDSEQETDSPDEEVTGSTLDIGATERFPDVDGVVSRTDAPNAVRVGTTLNRTFTIDDAYVEYTEWTIETETELRDVSWTVQEYDQGAQVSRWSGSTNTFSQELSAVPSGDELRISVRGRVPETRNYSYESPQAFGLVRIRQTTTEGSSELGYARVRQITPESQAARNSINEAIEAIKKEGGNNEAVTSVRQAIGAYDNGNFANATQLSQDAVEAIGHGGGDSTGSIDISVEFVNFRRDSQTVSVEIRRTATEKRVFAERYSLPDGDSKMCETIALPEPGEYFVEASTLGFSNERGKRSETFEFGPKSAMALSLALQEDLEINDEPYYDDSSWDYYGCE